MKKQNLLRIIVAIGVLAYFGYAHFKPKPHVAASPISPEATAPAPTRKFGTLAFSPCTLAPKMSAETVEAQCTTLAVPED